MTDITGELGTITRAPDRITGLDVTRGFAVMGILAMNIVAFAMPDNAYISPRVWGGDTGADLWVWATNYVLLDSKMRGLFSMLFGASTLLVIQSARTAGRSPARTHYARMVVLMLFGLAHYFLIWFGDILFLYAISGMILFAFSTMGVRGLVRWGIGLIAANTLLFSTVTGVLAYGTLAGAPAELADGSAEMIADFAHHNPTAIDEVAIYTSDFATIVNSKIADGEWVSPLTGLASSLMETVGLMLIGMALFKSGMLRGDWSLDRLARWRNRCLGIGIAANLVLLAWQFASGLDPIVLLFATFGASVPFDVIMTMGYAALFMGLAQRYATAPLIARFAATGRAAFTNYLGTSIVMTFVFYGWGLGQFGSWSRFGIYALVLAAWAVMLLWSKPWLDRYLYGPLEWLWRTLARGAVQPMRRTAVVN
jgi:uncharacterized protein